MYIFKTKELLQNHLLKLRSDEKTVGYVPTMGALHQGHLSLIRQSTAQNRVTLCSLFVNPTQFNELQDFDNYPIQVDQDILKLEEAGTEILFLPSDEEVYTEGMNQLEEYDFGALETLAEGAHRPGHFQGVAQVLSRFLNIIRPDQMYMGEKDYQQLLITRSLVRKLGMQTKVVGVPIVREEDGLAMSSRNLRLSEEARSVAPIMYQCLQKIRDSKGKRPLSSLLSKAKNRLKEHGFEVEYLMLANAENLEQEEEFATHDQILIIAAWLDGVRLIDNILLRDSGK